MATSSTRRRQHDANSLLQVAVRTFNERGYDGTSMDAIASAAGITKSSIYHHVSGKEALLGQALDHAVAALDDALLPAEQALQMHTRPIDAIETVVRRTTAALLKDVETITLFLRVRGNSETERRAIESRRAFDERVAGLLQAAADAGELNADIDTALMTRLVFGTVNSLVEWYRPGGRLTPQQVEDHVVTLVLHGLRNRD